MTCSVCGRLGEAKGLCRTHYERERYGWHERPKHSLFCMVPGCGAPYSAKGRCEIHYARWRRRQRKAL